MEVSSPLYVNGDMTFLNSASVRVPLYVTGNATFATGQGNGTNVDGSMCPNPVPVGNPGCLNVGGTLDLQANKSSVGTLSPPIPDAHIVVACKYLGVTATPCGNTTTTPPTTPPTTPWTGTKVFATTHDNTLKPRPFLPMTTF